MAATVVPSAVDNWFQPLYRQVHLDAHLGEFEQVYRGFDAEAAARALNQIGCQLVSYMAHDGPCYYPSEVGEPHPGLDRDFVGEFTRALKGQGIKTIVYVGVLSGEGDCRMPDVEGFLVPLYGEILRTYDVDGFFVDGMFQPYFMNLCDCQSCRARFADEVGGDLPTDDRDPQAFAYRRWLNQQLDDCVDQLWGVLSAIKPDVAFIYNHVWHTRHPVTPPPHILHVCWDTPVPGEGVYAWNFSFEARYFATLVDIRPHITWSCMNVASNDWVDYELRETEALVQESAILLAACGRTYPAYNPYPSGNPVPALMDAFGVVNTRTRELEPWVEGCRPVKDVAVLHGADSVWSKAPITPHASWTPSEAYHSVAGAHKALIEGHVQTLIPNGAVCLETLPEYGALVLAAQTILSDRETETIREFVRDGGALIATGDTGTRDTDNQLLSDFALADVLGVRHLESVESANAYLRVASRNEELGIPAMDIPVDGSYVTIETAGAEPLLELVPPYEGVRTGTPPPAVAAEGPGVVMHAFGKGKALYCAADLFGAYFRQDTPVLRKLGLWMLDLVHPRASRTITLEHAPISVEVFYNRRQGEGLVHLINHGADKREGGVSQTQGFVTVPGIQVRVQLASRPECITRVPSGQDVAFDYGDGWVSFEAAPLEIHEVYRIALGG
jgi:hypothetical protein